MTEDEIKGLAKDGTGNVKDVAGELSGDPALQTEGKFDQASGEIQGKFGDLNDQLGDAADTIAGKVAGFAGRAGSTMHGAAQVARHRAGQAGDTVYDASARVGQHIGRTVQSKPLLSLIGVVAIGYVVGFFLHSPTSPLVREPRSKQMRR